MKQALIVVDEIKRLQAAMKRSKSMQLKNDYRKKINRHIKDLKIYCNYKNIDFKEVEKRWL